MQQVLEKLPGGKLLGGKPPAGKLPVSKIASQLMLKIIFI